VTASTTLFIRLAELRQSLLTVHGELRSLARKVPAGVDSEGFDLGEDLRRQIQNAAGELEEVASELEPLPEHMRQPELAQTQVSGESHR